MNNSFGMNNFLQRILKKNENEGEGDTVVVDSAKLEVEYSPRRNKSNWIQKIGSYSPSKRDLGYFGKSPAKPIVGKKREQLNDCGRKNGFESEKKKEKIGAEMPDLEKIIREFEMGFLSPSKQETMETKKPRCFVKQIVAAFEEKYKAYNDFKMEADQSSQESEQETTLVNDAEIEEKKVEEFENENESEEPQEMEESQYFLEKTYVIDTFENEFRKYETKSVSCSRKSSESEYSEKCTFAMDEELTISTPAKKSSSLSSNAELKREKIEERKVRENSKSKAKNNVSRSDSSLRRERKPKIVGAFLKKPIDVENTSIDWIPITGKKLPRKKSFKRLLSVLKGGKKSLEKSSKLYCSQINLTEDNNSRELHDSGYDEKSCSSSSLASLVSITDLLLQRDKYEYEPELRTKSVSTFRQNFGIDNNNKTIVEGNEDKKDDFLKYDFTIEENESFEENIYDDCIVNGTKLLLEEIPRSEVRLSLGPSFPSSAPKFITNSTHSDRRISDDSTIVNQETVNNSIEKYDEIISGSKFLENLPKHPFVSLKSDKIQAGEIDNEEKVRNFNFLEFDNIELRRKSNFFNPANQEVIYDTPRRYLSKSEPKLTSVGRRSIDKLELDDFVVYDVPKPKIQQRPRSSVYEDALSSKRRNANHFNNSPPTSDFYAFPTYEEPHYATVKPRNVRINPSREMLRSLSDLSPQNFHAFF